MKQPKQKRSAVSLERVIEASEQILRNRSANDFTIAQIVETSGLSVGAIYARFSGKEGVFHELVSRFMRRTLSEFEQIDTNRYAALPLADLVDEVVCTNADIYFAHRGVLRAVLMRTKLAQDAALIQALGDYSRSVGTNLRQLFMAHAHEIEHPDPDEAISVAIETMTALLRESVIFADGSELDQRAVSRVQDLLKRYLQPSQAVLGATS